MSRTIPLRLSLAQVEHLRTLVARNRERNEHWGAYDDWHRRTLWLEAKLRDTQHRLANRINPPNGNDIEDDDDE